GFGRGDEGESLAGLEAGAEQARPEQILLSIQTALRLGPVMEIPVPVGAQRELAAISQQAIRLCTGEGGHAAAALFRVHSQLPATARLCVVIAVSAQRQQ